MRFERAIREEQQRADSILDVLQEGVLMVDTEGAINYAKAHPGFWRWTMTVLAITSNPSPSVMTMKNCCMKPFCRR